MAIELVNESHFKKIMRRAVIATAEDIFNNKDPHSAIQSGKLMIRSWAKTLPEAERTSYAQSFMLQVMEAFWAESHSSLTHKRRLPLLFKKVTIKMLDNSISAVAQAIGASASKLSVLESSYSLGSIYTTILSDSERTTNGVFYTPPSLTNRLIELAHRSGVNWSKAKIIDPACGGGAFLAPICLTLLEYLKSKKPKEILQHIETHLTGWEIDPFAGWLSQVFVEVALKDILINCEYSFRPIVTICNSIEHSRQRMGKFDLVIGNPPYGKVKLTDELRHQFGESLYGHPNLYGIFTHLALQLCKSSGIIAYLTPTSFLSGEYFKKLRSYIRFHTSVCEIDFVTTRKGVFEDVLQETMLASYVKTTEQKEITINELSIEVNDKSIPQTIGKYSLPSLSTSPWILPRNFDQNQLAKLMLQHRYRLSDWGYRISTGPLVWNRHKPQLSYKEGINTFPIVWAESISSFGVFKLKADKVNHKPHFRFKKGDEWLITRQPCILLQRTTAKEQDKRLIAAVLPESLRKKGVAIENHLNMIIAVDNSAKVSIRTLSVFLNSQIVNKAFRSISGSVAVSAFELESLPLPAPEVLSSLDELLSRNAKAAEIEAACDAIYQTLL
jgi:adenine-specific DNA-methyltransferase